MTIQRALRLLPAAALVLAAAIPGNADTVGLRAGRYTELKQYFLGFELLAPLGPRVYVNPNLEYVFVPNRTYMTFNLDFHVDFRTATALFFWVGAGAAAIYDNPDGPARADVNLGANALLGLGLRAQGLIPYVQLKLLLARENRDDLVLAFGLRF